MKKGFFKVLPITLILIFVTTIMSFIGTDHTNGKVADVVNAALDYGDGKVYAFNGVRYVKYDKGTSKVDAGYPKVTEVGWGKIAKGPIYAAVYDGSNSNWQKVYLFGENRKFWRYDKKTEKFDAGYPKLIYNEWKGLPRTTTQDIDAVFSYQNGYMYFFYDNYCYLYNRKSNKVEGGKRLISTEFNGVPNDIDAAVYYKNTNKIYFFKGLQYYRVNGSTKKVDAGYPKTTTKYWKGFEAIQTINPNYQPPTQPNPPVVTGGNISDIPTDATFTEAENTNIMPAAYLYVSLKKMEITKAPSIIDENGKAMDIYENIVIPNASVDVSFNRKHQLLLQGNEFRNGKATHRRVGEPIIMDKEMVVFNVPKDATEKEIKIKMSLNFQGVVIINDVDFDFLAEFDDKTITIPFKDLKMRSTNERKYKLVSQKSDGVAYFTYEFELRPFKK